MKLICTYENFKKAIYNCERIVSKKNTLPILNNLLFEIEKGGLKISATNLEIGIIVKIGAKIEKEGKITIPAKIISSFSGNLLGGDNIILETVEDKLKIKSGSNKTIIRGVITDDFPLIPTKKTEYLLNISNFEFKNMLAKVMPAVAFNEARQELTGINLIFKEKELFFAATDSFRLAEYKMDIKDENINKENYTAFISKIENIIIPSATLVEINRIISNSLDGRIKIAIEEGQIFFEMDETRVVSRLINGKYPEYKHIMPKEYKTEIIGDKNLTQNAAKMAGIFSLGNTGEITLKIDQEAKKIFMLSANADTGENSTELKFEAQGPSQEIVFNARYLLDGINVVSTSRTAILAYSEVTPVAIKEVDEKTGKVLENFTYIVMPVKN